MTEAGAERRKFFFDYLIKEKYQINPNHLYKPRDGDVIIVGPPKSGTTWLQQICHQIRTKGDESFDDIYDVTWYIVHPSGQLYDLNGEQVCNPRIYKHHEVYGVIKTTNKQKHLLITRDPYDTTVSWMKFINRWYGGEADMDEAEAAQLLEELHRNKKLSHFNMLSSWWPHRKDPNTLQLFYEDLVAQPKSVIKIVADFMSVQLNNEEELDRIANYCSFEWMQKHENKFRHNRLIETRAMATGIESWTPKMGCVRPDGGQVGQGRQLGQALKATINKLWADTMLKLYGIQNYQEMYNTYGLFPTKSFI